MRIETRLRELGLTLPPEPKAPPGFQFSFDWVRISGNRCYVSGHSPQHADGTLAGPFGRVPSEVGIDAACDAARATALSMFGSLERALGDLDRITAWLRVEGMVNADNGFPQSTVVVDGFSDVVACVFGPHIGAHARTAIGVAGLPMNNAVVVAAELEIT